MSDMKRDTPVPPPPPPPKRLRGVGDHVKCITQELGLRMKQGCDCEALAAEMNRLGPDGCRRERKKLVDGLRHNARQYSWGEHLKAAAKSVTTGLIWSIDITDPYGSMLDEAIRRAERDAV